MIHFVNIKNINLLYIASCINQCLTMAGSDDEDGAVGLRGASDHVLDEIPVARGIDDGDVVVLGLELPQSDIDGDTTFTLGLQLIQNPGVLEGAFAHLEKSGGGE